MPGENPERVGELGRPDWWVPFVVEYEARWGDFPKPGEDTNAFAFFQVWYRALDGLTTTMVPTLCDSVQQRMNETSYRGKPRVASFQGFVAQMTKPWEMKHQGTREDDIIRTPLFDMRENPPKRLRKPFLIELPAKVQKECWRIHRDAMAPNVDREKVHAAFHVLFGAAWEDYSEAEKQEIRKFRGHAVRPPSRAGA